MDVKPSYKKGCFRAWVAATAVWSVGWSIYLYYDHPRDRHIFRFVERHIIDDDFVEVWALGMAIIASLYLTARFLVPWVRDGFKASQ